MYIKIYFEDKPLYLCSDIDAAIEPLIHHDDTVFIDELNTHTVKTMIHEMQQPRVHAGVFYHNNLEELKKAFFKKFDLVPAAGAVVLNEKKEVLLIFRRGKWDLPKGKLDKNEKPETCALRETEEETGLRNLKLSSFLTITYHTYHEGARFKLKETNWFIVKSEGKQELTPQSEEDIEKVIWATQRDLERYMNNSYTLVREILHQAFEAGS